jgi:hypothetical protein
MAGTKMLEEMGEKTPAIPEIPTMRYFVDWENAEYGLVGSVERTRCAEGNGEATRVGVADGV